MHTKKINSRIVPLNKARIRDSFWSGYIDLVRDVVVPYQWEALNDRVPGAERSYAVSNFKIAAGDAQGEYGGMVFQDSDVAKWLEAVGYLLQTEPDPELERTADEMIDVIARAQHPDGYLNTYFTLKEPGKRWSNLAECHELYCAGHMIEAAVAYYEATGKRKILDVVCKFADYICTVFGNELGQISGYDGHQEIELALIKLYRATGNEKYLKQSEYFLNQRGTEPHFYAQEFEARGKDVHYPHLDIVGDLSYSQAHKPIREQDTAEGHAVRLVYMLTAMADLAAESGDERLLEACRTLWDNIVSKRMYITGGIGSMAEGESFTADYDLPNDTAYAETCASIGLIFFAHRMLQIEPNGKYADVLEKALYNTVVSGISKDGKQFFYVNPLEVYPHVCGKNHIYDHVKPHRQGWFGCACCPPNLARLLASLGQYIYGVDERTIYTHLYIGGETDIQLDGDHVGLKMDSRYVEEGKVQIGVSMGSPAVFTLALRIPEWSDGALISVNGVPLAEHERIVQDGYVRITTAWQSGDIVDIAFRMPVRRMKGHPSIRHTASKVAIQRGPFIYCLEEVDNGANLHEIVLPASSEFSVSSEPGLLGGLPVIKAGALRISASEWDEDELYRDMKKGAWQETQTTATFIPYFAWANREGGEMAVWVKDR
ncbi:glycoside hydrolase family 127 protein [Paenibacillus sp. LHD-117]|uniref:glycoside hydrolase family 127 protein n=1 Tax=Paenibacillus sp. LHD-117 TaxID=3071412 RepID=UPI0027DFB2F9|nr:beta-L-arabinofuranosidase domain-containing protein [Paenibacillus sp. LHD-117]MDQ6420114.1 glycoside hydrolase family 127 protein [Paenibacillus sp. LHD-117]